MVKNLHIVKDVKRYAGFIIDVYNTTFDTPDGPFVAEVLRHPGGACIAATHDNVNFYVVDQFRFAAEAILTEFPAGKRDADEDPMSVALRELQEETGYKARTIVPLGFVHASPAFLNERLYLFYATDLEYVGQSLDPGEDLKVYQMSLDAIEDAIMSNTITDGKTIALAMKVRHYLNSNK